MTKQSNVANPFPSGSSSKTAQNIANLMSSGEGLRMNAKDFAKLVNSGIRPVVTFKASVDDKEGYWEANMRGRITAARDNGDDVMELTVDVTEFDEFNKPFESANYYDKNQNPTLTAREAGFYKAVDTMYFDANEDVGQVLTVEDDSSIKLFNEYRESGSDLSYVTWLERQVLAARWESCRVLS